LYSTFKRAIQRAVIEHSPPIIPFPYLKQHLKWLCVEKLLGVTNWSTAKVIEVLPPSPRGQDDSFYLLAFEMALYPTLVQNLQNTDSQINAKHLRPRAQDDKGRGTD